jgi:hypothetical protein
MCSISTLKGSQNQQNSKAQNHISQLSSHIHSAKATATATMHRHPAPIACSFALNHNT